MGFYQLQPFNQAEAQLLAADIFPPLIRVEVSGNARNYTSGIQLVRDHNWVGGLKIDVMGWTGPLGEGTTPYKVTATFQSIGVNSIIVVGSNKVETIPVTTIGKEEVEDFLKQKALSK